MCNWFRFGALFAMLVGGCSSGPERVKPPKIDPGSAASEAMELYDTNHDGKLTQEELAQCPGVLVSIARYDANHDKAIDQEEFRSHLSDLLKNRTGATQLGCNVAYQGKPLAGAKVLFEPEPYLGDEIQSAEGVTTNAGVADIGMPPDKAPAALKAMKLIQYGTFKVRITHPSINLPAKYNTETTLGYETIPGEPTVNFVLK
jgi:EF hand domain-containing protein